MAKNQFKLNGYDLTLKMRKSRRKYALNSTDQALYYELVAICNEDGWDRYFKCSNWELCNALKISENTLVKSRRQLIKADLIHFKSGKSKREYSTYSFLTTSNSEVVNSTTEQTTEESTSNNEVKGEVKAADYYKEKEKLNLNNIHIYSDKEFLEMWKAKKMKYDKKLTHIKKLNSIEKDLLTELANENKKKDFENALTGFFMQKNMYENMRTRPKNFLENFEIYLDCWQNNEQLYEPIKNSKKSYKYVRNSNQEASRVGKTRKEAVDNLSNSEGFSVNRT